MKAEVAEKFIMLALENTRYYKENGKYYVACDYPDLPEGFEMIFGTGFTFNGKPVETYRTGAIREESRLPISGEFTRQIANMASLSDVKMISMAIAINAPNANTESFDKDECTLTIVVEFQAGKVSNLTATMGYTAGGYKDAGVQYSDIFDW